MEFDGFFDDLGATLVFDTTQQTPASIGAELWAQAGDLSIADAIRDYGSAAAAAKAVVDYLDGEGVTVLDEDRRDLDVAELVLAYIDQD